MEVLPLPCSRPRWMVADLQLTDFRVRITIQLAVHSSYIASGRTVQKTSLPTVLVLLTCRGHVFIEPLPSRGRFFDIMSQDCSRFWKKHPTFRKKVQSSFSFPSTHYCTHCHDKNKAHINSEFLHILYLPCGLSYCTLPIILHDVTHRNINNAPYLIKVFIS
jgi:hypothetical protein